MKIKLPDNQPEISSQEKILDSAQEEFITYGYEGARIQRIASMSGANKAMIYYYYGSKENLYRLVLRRIFSGAFRTLGTIISEEQPVEDKLKALIMFYIDIYKKNPGFVRVLLRELAAEKSMLREVLAEIRRSAPGFDIPDAFGRILSGAVKKGIVRQVDARHTFMSLIGMSAGFFIFRPIAETMIPLSSREAKKFAEERAGHVADLLLNGIMERRKEAGGED